MQSIKEEKKENERDSFHRQSRRDLRGNLRGRERRYLVEVFQRRVEVSYLRSDFV
jgi:hypothetical protein